MGGMLTSCGLIEAAWMAEYRREGGWYKQQPSYPTPEEAAENLKAVQHLATHL